MRTTTCDVCKKEMNNFVLPKEIKSSKVSIFFDRKALDICPKCQEKIKSLITSGNFLQCEDKAIKEDEEQSPVFVTYNEFQRLHGLPDSPSAYLIEIPDREEVITNGDMIKAMFPKAEYNEHERFVRIWLKNDGNDYVFEVPMSFWNSTYRRE